MVEKRTIVFITLAMLVWALLATGLAAYHYFEQARYRNQLEDKQRVINELAENYDKAANKRNLLLGDYGLLLGESQWFSGEDYSPLLDKFHTLLFNLNKNYTSTLNEFSELNAAYNELLNKTQTLSMKNQVTKEEFGYLLSDYQKLFTAVTTKEFEGSLAEIGKVEVSLCIDYGNGTIAWHNTSIASGATLFDLTRKVAKIEYSYLAAMEPGHIFVTSINNHVDGWWIWYFWSETEKSWIIGPVGCDAWVLNNHGIYNWTCMSS